MLPSPRRRDRGAVIPLVALGLTVLMTMTAFAVDLGRMRVERRDLQADADAMSLDAVQTIAGMHAAAAQPVAEAEAAASAARNGVDPSEIASVEVGEWIVDTQTFQPMTTDRQFPDSVRVILTDAVEMFFDFSTDERSVTRTGVAVASGATRGAVGSVLAGLQQTVDPMTAPCRVQEQVSFMNSIYTSMLGITADVVISGDAEVDSGECAITTPATGLKLDALSWQGLGAGRATLDDIAAEMGLGDRDAFFAGTVDARDFLDATATVLQNSPDVVDAQAGTMLGQIVAAMTATSQIDIGALVDPGTGGPASGGVGAATGDGSAAKAGVDALTLLTGTAMLIDGENVASASVPLTLPYLDGPVDTTIHVIEAPQTHEELRLAGDDGPKTGAARIAVEVPLKDLELDLSLLGLVGTQLAPGSLNFVVEVSRAESTYDSITCPNGEPTEVAMSVDTGAVTLAYGTSGAGQLTAGETVEVESSTQVDAQVVINLPVVGSVAIDLSQVTDVEETQYFMTTADAATFSGGEANLLGDASPHTFTTFGDESPWHRYAGGISGTQLADLTYAEIQYNAVLGDVLTLTGISQASIENMVRNALDATVGSIVQSVGANIIDPLLQSLGITVAGADGRILDVTCRMPALANRG